MSNPHDHKPQVENPEHALVDDELALPSDHPHVYEAEEAEDARLSTVSTDSQSYRALVWRRFRKSTPGMLGLTLVVILLVVAFFANFFAPMDPKEPNVAFSPPDKISFYNTEKGWRLWPVMYRIVETDEFDP